MSTFSCSRTGDALSRSLFMRQAPELQEICTQLATNYFKSDTHTESVTDGEEHHKQYTVDSTDMTVNSGHKQSHFPRSTALTSKRMSMQYSSSSKDSMVLSYNVSEVKESADKKDTTCLSCKREPPNLNLSELLGDLNTSLSNRSKDRLSIDQRNHQSLR